MFLTTKNNIKIIFSKTLILLEIMSVLRNILYKNFSLNYIQYFHDDKG